ncbi:MAG: hypothetical protein JNG84_06260, partial [Archangium sp.]|nr:hypothetical protein [Archangium sp.]
MSERINSAEAFKPIDRAPPWLRIVLMYSVFPLGLAAHALLTEDVGKAAWGFALPLLGATI